MNGLWLLTTLLAVLVPPPHDLSRLTASRAVLGDACQLAPDHTGPPGWTQVQPLRLPGNPWSGDDFERVAAIGAIVLGAEGAPRLPDGPPLDRRMLNELRRQEFEGATGYAAAYRRAETLTLVYALWSSRLEASLSRGLAAGSLADDSSHEVFRHKGLRVRVWGSRGPCFDALRRHVEQTLAEIPIRE